MPTSTCHDCLAPYEEPCVGFDPSHLCPACRVAESATLATCQDIQAALELHLEACPEDDVDGIHVARGIVEKITCG